MSSTTTRSVAARWRLDGCRALVTGGTRGIGHAVAEELLALGAHVFVVARQAESLERCLAQWHAAGHAGCVNGCAADVSTGAGRALLLEQLATGWGDLDILVNN